MQWGAALETGEDMAEFAIDFLLSGRGSAHRLLQELALRWPQRPALEFALVMSLAANGIEANLTGETATRLASDAWRMAAMLGVELYDAQALGLPHQTGADLIAYWQSYDMAFVAG